MIRERGILAAGTACPADLTAVVDRARHRLRVVAEFSERATAADPSGVRAAVAALPQPILAPSPHPHVVAIPRSAASRRRREQPTP